MRWRPTPGVVEVHDLHVWELSAGFPALSAHVLVAPEADCHAARRALQELLRGALRRRAHHAAGRARGAAGSCWSWSCPTGEGGRRSGCCCFRLFEPLPNKNKTQSYYGRVPKMRRLARHRGRLPPPPPGLCRSCSRGHCGAARRLRSGRRDRGRQRRQAPGGGRRELLGLASRRSSAATACRCGASSSTPPPTPTATSRRRKTRARWRARSWRSSTGSATTNGPRSCSPPAR